MQAQNRVGQTLGNYRLVKLLGKGGYSEVYLAENIHLGVQTAIKVLKLHNLDDIEQEKFRSEAKFMTTLEHPRIIKVLDYGIEMSLRGHGDGSTPYIVMEYAPLGTLRHLYPHRTPMPLPKIASYTKQIAEALQYAHDKNIIHLDVKPENMLVRRPDDVALSDFGIAVAGLNTSNLQLQQEEILRKMALGEQISIPGTAPYLAPERLEGHTKRASDQYSLAIVVYEWLTGKRPFEGSDLEICQKHEKQPPPPLYKHYAYISQEVEQVVMKALSKSSTDRYKSVRDFALALESAIQAAQPVQQTAQQTLQQLPPPSSSPFSPGIAPMPNPNTPPISPPSSSPFSPGLAPMPNPGSPPIFPPSVPAFATPYQYSNATNVSSGPTPPGGNTSNQPATPWPGNPPQVQGQTQWQAQPGFGYADPTVANLSPNMQRSAPQPKEFSVLLAEFFEDPGTSIKEIFVVDKYFLKKKRTREFLLVGVPANILSALIVLIVDGFILHVGIQFSIMVAIFGAILSIVMLRRCAISVKKPVAITFGLGVALWWSCVALLVIPDDPVLGFVGVLFTFAISLLIHLWYVNTRLLD